MKKADYLIVGGGIAGTSAAEFIRQREAEGSITIVMEEDQILYSRVLLPHYLRDQTTFEKIYVRKPASYEENKIELLKSTKAISIDTQNKKVILSSGEEITYDKLLIASGGKVNKLQVPGADLPEVTYLRTIKDVEYIKDLMKNSKQGAVIGGGFIGIEYAQSFVKNGIKTSALIRDRYFWDKVVGEASGKLISKILQENGVEIVSEVQVSEFKGSDKLEIVKLTNGQEIAADIAGVGIGIHMELDHLKDSGLKINKGLITNEYLETETKDVWAAGDIAEFFDVLFDKHHQMGNWSNAGAQGKVVGPNMVAGWGTKEEGNGREKFITVSAYTISIFGTPFAFMGDPVPDDQTEFITRGSVEGGKIGRLHIKNGVLVGASLINLAADRSAIGDLIKNKVKIEVERDKLADLSFSLGSLLPK